MKLFDSLCYWVGSVIIGSCILIVSYVFVKCLLIYLTRSYVFYNLVRKANKHHELDDKPIHLFVWVFFKFGWRLLLMGDNDTFSNKYLHYSPSKSYIMMREDSLQKDNNVV